jgi:hypothetical protein
MKVRTWAGPSTGFEATVPGRQGFQRDHSHVWERRLPPLRPPSAAFFSLPFLLVVPRRKLREVITRRRDARGDADCRQDNRRTKRVASRVEWIVRRNTQANTKITLGFYTFLKRSASPLFLHSIGAYTLNEIPSR